jgi:glucose dehydrogenase
MCVHLPGRQTCEETMDTVFRVRAVVWATGIFLILIGLYLTVGGGWLLALGGSPYYLVSGVVLILSGALLFRGSAMALWLYTAVLLAACRT